MASALDMRPSPAAYDAANRLVADTELCRQDATGNAILTQPAELPHLIRSHLRLLTTLAAAIVNVVLLGSHEQVIRSDAERRVAVVQNKVFVRQIAVGESVGIAMSKARTNAVLGEHPVPLIVLCSGPQPTVAGSINVAPEALLGGPGDTAFLCQSAHARTRAALTPALLRSERRSADSAGAFWDAAVAGRGEPRTVAGAEARAAPRWDVIPSAFFASLNSFMRHMALYHGKRGVRFGV